MIKLSAKDADTVFHYENFPSNDALREAFNKYFSDLPDTNEKPFKCPMLRVLDKSIGVIFSNRPPWRYETEDLICTYGAKKDLSRRCRFGGLNTSEREISRGVRWKKGELKLYCPIGDIEIHVKPVGVTKKQK